MGFFDALSNHAESKERHTNLTLMTHYYKTNYDKVKETVSLACKHFNYKISSIDDTHGEIFIKTNRFHMIVTIIQVTPRETAVDIKVETYRLFGFNKPKRLIETMYKKLNQSLELKGKGLHP